MIMKKKKSGESNGLRSSVQKISSNAKSASTKAAAAVSKNYAVIDYPLEGEIITSAWYSVRIGASQTDRVEVSFDGKAWQPCRQSNGFWWYDWSGYGSGAHSVSARVFVNGKPPLKSKARQFTVLI